MRVKMAMGRPRDFDVDKALDCALQVFWKKGYEGTSLSDLTEAMDINRPSLYAAFGNKEDLFIKALDRYGEKTACVYKALEEPKARDAVEKMLFSLAESQTGTDGPRGCLMINGALACSETGEPIKKELITRRAAGEAALRQRLERAAVENDLPPGANPADLARYIATVCQGMAVQAASGATGAQLKAVAATALQGWPKRG
jgi:AcrR family transcriptional regulator